MSNDVTGLMFNHYEISIWVMSSTKFLYQFPNSIGDPKKFPVLSRERYGNGWALSD